MKNKILSVLFVIVFAFFLFHSGLFDRKDVVNSILPDVSDSEVVLITPKYSSNETIVADYVLEPSSNATLDRTNDIQNALNSCRNNHGGTVFLKDGVYRISKTILIPRGCTLYGDWQDPDTTNPNYGTIITVDVNNIKYDAADNNNIEATGLFRLSSNSGVVGLTIYYENQGFTNGIAKDQPWTFYYSHGELDWKLSNGTTTKDDFYSVMSITIKNVTMINSFRGIGESIYETNPHSMLNIENVKGTAIYKGVVIHNSNDVGTVTGLTLKPDYWANANLQAIKTSNSKPSKEEIVNSFKNNNSFGLYITDIEQQQFANVTISDYNYCVYIPGEKDEIGNTIPRRAMGSGLMYNFKLTNCTEGIYAGRGFFLNHYLGYQLSHSTIEGTRYSIHNDGANFNGTNGLFKLTDVTLKGKTFGYILYNNNLGTDYSDGSRVDSLNSSSFGNINLNRKMKTMGKSIITLKPTSNTKEDRSSAIQNALNQIGNKGGGVVYLKPGVYEVDKQINVPCNVELRGSNSTLARQAGIPGTSTPLGTVININPEKIGTKVASSIELIGNNSGVSGIMFIYEKNNSVLQCANCTNYVVAAPTIASHNTTHAYINNVAIMGAAYGIGIDSCQYFTINNVKGTTFNNFIGIVNSKNGLIKNTLSNSTILSLNSLYYFNPGYFINLINITHNKQIDIVINNTSNIEGLNNFVFGANTYLAMANSSGYFVNNGHDTWPQIVDHTVTNSVMYNINNSTLMAINTQRINGATGKLYAGSSNNANIYNNLALIPNANSNASKNEKDIVSTTKVNPISKIPEYTPTPISVIKGDVNGDSKITSLDYVIIRMYILGSMKLDNNQIQAADINSDTKVNSQDYVLLRKKIMGIT